jgi:hypothetical protein
MPASTLNRSQEIDMLHPHVANPTNRSCNAQASSIFTTPLISTLSWDNVSASFLEHLHHRFSCHRATTASACFPEIAWMVRRCSAIEATKRNEVLSLARSRAELCSVDEPPARLNVAIRMRVQVRTRQSGYTYEQGYGGCFLAFMSQHSTVFTRTSLTT